MWWSPFLVSDGHWPLFALFSLLPIVTPSLRQFIYDVPGDLESVYSGNKTAHYRSMLIRWWVLQTFPHYSRFLPKIHTNFRSCPWAYFHINCLMCVTDFAERTWGIQRLWYEYCWHIGYRLWWCPIECGSNCLRSVMPQLHHQAVSLHPIRVTEATICIWAYWGCALAGFRRRWHFHPHNSRQYLGCFSCFSARMAAIHRVRLHCRPLGVFLNWKFRCGSCCQWPLSHFPQSNSYPLPLSSASGRFSCWDCGLSWCWCRQISHIRVYHPITSSLSIWTTYPCGRWYASMSSVPRQG